MRKTLGLATCSVLAITVATPVLAQDNTAEDAEPDNTIIVTGIRDSLAAAAQEKRNANQVKEVITAEDIGKLPDDNIAEAMQRVTGVQISRDEAGEGSNFQVRGISDNRVEVDGRTLLSDNAENNSTSFTGVSSQLFAGVEVIKSPSAEDVEGSLGATIRLITRKPLNTKNGLISIRVAGGYDELRSDKIDPQISALTNLRWDAGDGEMGLLLNASWQNYSSRTEQFGSNGWEPVRGAQGNTLANPPAGRIFRPRVGRIQRFDFERERIGVEGAFQWAPTPELTFTLSGNYNTFESMNNEAKVVMAVNEGFVRLRDDGVFNAITINRPAQGEETTDQTNSFIIAGAAQPSQPRVNPTQTFQDYETLSGSFKAEYDGFPWKATLEITAGEAENSRQNISVNFVPPFNARPNVRTTWDFSPAGNGPPNINFSFPGTINLESTEGFRVSNFFINDTFGENDEFSARADFEYEVGGGFLSTLKAGMRYSRRTAAGSRNELRGPRANISPQLQIADFPSEISDSIIFLEDPLFERFNTTTPGLFFTLNALTREEFDAFRGVVLPAQGLEPNLLYPFQVEEDVFAGYVQADYDFDIGIPVRGNFGVRLVQTDINSSGNLFNGTTATPVTETNSYFKALPSANIAFEITPDMILRFAAAKVLSRPDVIDLSPALNLPGNAVTARRGNPFLQPYEADQLDVSFEWYFNRNSLFSAAAFYKEVDAFLIDNSFSAIIDPTVDRNGDGIPGNVGDEVLVSFPDNGDSGKIKGFELGLQTTFDFLPGFLSGFGIVANFTYTDSSQPDQNFDPINGGVLPLPQLSKKSYNLIGFYEKYGFELRVAYNYRDEVFQGFPFGIPPEFRDSFDQLDISASYRFRNYSIFASASNVTSSTIYEYQGIREATSLFRDTGPRYTAGISARF